MIVPKEIESGFICWEELPTNLLYSFLHRVAHLGHLTHLGLKLFEDFPVPDKVGKELIDAVIANKNLKSLNLCMGEWDLYMQDMFIALGEHENIRTLVLERYPIKLDPTLSWLKKLLKQNRRIKVSERRRRDECPHDRAIDEMYAVNRFFCCSETLVKEQPFIRPSLVGKGLLQNTTSNFMRSALLLTQHTDVLCEFLQESGSSIVEDNSNRVAVLFREKSWKNLLNMWRLSVKRKLLHCLLLPRGRIRCSIVQQK